MMILVHHYYLNWIIITVFVGDEGLVELMDVGGSAIGGELERRRYRRCCCDSKGWPYCHGQ